MTRIKKQMALLTIFILTLSLFSGCGEKVDETNESGAESNASSVEESTDSTNSNVETSSEEQIKKPSGKITVWGWEFINKNLELNMEAFQAEYPDIEVEFQTVTPQDVYQKMLLGLSAGGEGLPDVATIETSNLAQFVQFEGLMDLTEQVAPYIDKMNDFKWADASKDGKIYAMPWDSGPVALYYRTDVFEKAGLPTEPDQVSELLATWDDYYETAKIIKEKTGSYMFPEGQEKSTGRNFEKLLWQQEKLYFDEDGQPILDSPEAVKAMTYLVKFVKEDLADNTEDWTQPWYDSLNDGTVATYFGASWMGGFLQSWIAPEAVGQWRVIPLPKWGGFDNVAANDGGSNLVIPDTSENKEAAWAFVEFMVGREESQIKMYKETDVFPSLETTYSDAFFDEQIDYYGGQAVRRVFADTVDDIPVLEYTLHYSQANEFIREAFAKILYSDYSVEDALKEANEQVKTKIN